MKRQREDKEPFQNPAKPCSSYMRIITAIIPVGFGEFIRPSSSPVLVLTLGLETIFSGMDIAREATPATKPSTISSNMVGLWAHNIQFPKRDTAMGRQIAEESVEVKVKKKLSQSERK
jgi:hypothetical protein